MNKRISDTAIGATVIILATATIGYFLLRRDDCLDKAHAFVRSAPILTARVGKITSVGTSAWLSGQAAQAGERSFYFLVKSDRATLSAIVSADRATCICRLVSINEGAVGDVN